jgi:CHAT domain-containing protein
VAPIDADHPESADGRLAAARSIGDALSAIPVNDDAEHLIVAAHGPLHGFPFAAFINGTTTLPRTTTAVTHVPSLSVLALALSRSRDNARPQTFAAYAVTSADDEDRESFECVLDEVAFAAATVRASGPAASKSAVVRALETVDVLHLTCHGLFDDADPLGSGLLLGNGTDRPPRAPRTTDERDSFVLTARELLDTESRCRLVALQACSSGVQQERNLGDEFEGLIRALLYSGVSTVIVSLWNVDRDSSNAAFRVFYREWLGTGVPVGVAWQRAQVALRDGGEPAWRHPYHWAPFACIGDFR